VLYSHQIIVEMHQKNKYLKAALLIRIILKPFKLRIKQPTHKKTKIAMKN